MPLASNDRPVALVRLGLATSCKVYCGPPPAGEQTNGPFCPPGVTPPRQFLLLARLIGLTFVSGDSLSRVRAESARHRIYDPHRWHLRAAFLDTCPKAHREILRMKARLFCRA